MLQQTRVDTVIPYYHRFLEAFPTLEKLAGANQQEVLKLWEGLGYYSRARNLHQAAQTVVREYQGKLPEDYKEIRKLKGIGPYTAAALLSIAYQLPHAVVDGNVLRVLARFYGIEEDIRSRQTQNQIQELADEVIPTDRPGDFNQALMELGATLCSTSNPECPSCPLSATCTAYRTAATDTLPYKSPAGKVPHHHIGVGIIVDKNDNLLIALRPEEAMLGGLWEFPGGKQKKDEAIRSTVARELHEELGVEVEVLEKFTELKHAYSHFKITLHAFRCRIKTGKPNPKTSQELRWVSVSQLRDFPFPKANKTLTEKLQEEGIKGIEH